MSLEDLASRFYSLRDEWKRGNVSPIKFLDCMNEILDSLNSIVDDIEIPVLEAPTVK